MSDLDFEAGRLQGWSERDKYTRERRHAYSRSMFGWPLMAIGVLIILWCAIIFGLSGTNVVTSTALGALLTLGSIVATFGWRHNIRERQEQLRRIDDFHSRWDASNRQAPYKLKP